VQVKVSEVGDKVILEPLKKPSFDPGAWCAGFDQLGGREK